MDIQELNRIALEIGQFVKQSKDSPHIVELCVSRPPQYPTGVIFTESNSGEWYMHWDGGMNISEDYISVLYRILKKLNDPFLRSVN